ncbi:MAG: antitoxin VbhA family protein [Oscillospiraceae bacterium]
MPEMTVERAVNNAIVSNEMEGFTFTEEQRVLLKKVVNKELTLKEALEILNS